MLQEVIKVRLQSETQLHGIEFAEETAVSDERLVHLVLAGDESAFAEIFERYKRPMTRVVGRYFRERADIEDLVQQSFTKAYFSLKSFKGGDDRSFAGWLTRISVNVCYDEFRRKTRKGERLFAEMSTDEADYVETVVDVNRPSAETSIIATQLAEKVLSSLDIKDRIAITLVYSENHSLSEVADAIGITTSNLKSRLFRCRNQIKQRFGHLFV